MRQKWAGADGGEMNNMEQSARKHLLEHKRKIQAWKKAQELDVIYNKALEYVVPSKIKYILVADNPGKKEKEEGCYLSKNGSAGHAAREFFRSKLGKDFDSEILVLNKSPIYTETTSGLKSWEARFPEKTISESQEHMASLLLALMRTIPEAEVWIIGVSEMCPTKIFRYFTKKLLRDATLEEMTRISYFKHFSRNWFFRDLSLTKDEIIKIGKEELLKVLEETSKKNREKISDRWCKAKGLLRSHNKHLMN